MLTVNMLSPFSLSVEILNIFGLSVVVLSFVAPSVTLIAVYASCRYRKDLFKKCCNVDCHYAECLGAKQLPLNNFYFPRYLNVVEHNKRRFHNKRPWAFNVVVTESMP